MAIGKYLTAARLGRARTNTHRLQAFLRVMFIDWIGGFFRRLFVSKKRET